MAADDEVMQMNGTALKFCARLVDAVIQLRQEVDRTYTMLGLGGWDGYDYAAKFDQLLDETDAWEGE